MPRLNERSGLFSVLKKILPGWRHHPIYLQRDMYIHLSALRPLEEFKQMQTLCSPKEEYHTEMRRRKANREMVGEWGGLQSFNDHRKWWYMAASLEDHIEERQSKWEPSYFLDISRLPLNLEFRKPWVFVGIDSCFNFSHLTWHFSHQRGFSFNEGNQTVLLEIADGQVFAHYGT